MVRLWNRLIAMPDSRLTKQIFLWDISTGNAWSNKIECVFEETGLQHIFRNKLKCNIAHIKSILFDTYKQKWADEIWLKPKLRTYCLLKSGYHPELYVTLNLTRIQRSICAQYRCGILPLALETGRFHSIPEDERKCQLCDLFEIENETHFLFHCPLYHNHRQKLFGKIPDCRDLLSFSDESNLSFLFNNHVFPLAAFLSDAYQTRKSTLFSVR